ncbi:YdcF family protein [Paenibacillus sp. N1-5-1-14]|uniref:YdcF family protein n=1 Tax=Paenibacillus radicibacter TaxID=2972488 RepID=UPI002158C4B1|nr:YdcF family protein [Paenibacillus radicibacter]MCR8643658.1 YdcF family protein [Paenibacillus radicibacter]
MVIVTIMGFILLAVFGFLFTKERRRISLGYVLSLSLFLVLFSLMYYISMINLGGITGLLVLGFVFGIIPLGIVLLSFYLFVNGRLMLQREGRRLANLLSLILSIMMMGMIVFGIYILFLTYNINLYYLYITVLLLFLYYAYIFMSYLVYAVFYHFAKISYTPDFIIVLGSGLIGGERVPPLLASRLDKGIEQFKKYKDKPKIIVSGGQGPDELLSEAAAMKKYLLEQGMQENDVLMEDQSRNTLQNMTFSKRIMDQYQDTYKSIFITNNYHVLRASFYARQAGLNPCEGVGSRTARYYLPSAFLREYIGTLMMYKWWHVAISIMIILFVYVSRF